MLYELSVFRLTCWRRRNAEKGLHELELVENSIVVIWVGDSDLVLEFWLQEIGILFRRIGSEVNVPDVGPCDDRNAMVKAIGIFEFGVDLCYDVSMSNIMVRGERN